MGATYDDDALIEGETGPRRHLTTIVLEPDEAIGGWRATQHGIPVEGRGETAADAAADYCRKVEGDDA